MNATANSDKIKSGTRLQITTTVVYIPDCVFNVIYHVIAYWNY